MSNKISRVESGSIAEELEIEAGDLLIGINGNEVKDIIDYRWSDKSLYIEEGYADFEKVVYDKDFVKGVERLKAGCEKGYRIALMGAKQNPIECHRCILVGRALRSAGFNVKHILDDYSLASQEDLEEELLEKYYGTRAQIDFDTYLMGEPSKEDMIKQCYKLGSKEIGYRVERIKKK